LRNRHNITPLLVCILGTIHGLDRETISNRTVTKLRLVLDKYGSPTGDITFTIRKVSDDSVMCSKVWGDASGLTTDPALYEVTFDTPTSVDEEVRILAEFAGGNVDNQVLEHVQASDVKADEYSTYYDGSWNSLASYDTAYRYTWQEPAPPAPPPTFMLDPKPRTRARFYPSLELG